MRPALMMMSLPLAALAALTGCGGGGGYGDIGVTPGGTQDINHARELIADGWIPTADDYTAEGLFSEHDLPLDGTECEQTLCPRAAAAHIDPVDGSGSAMLVQLGFATALTEIKRPTLDLVVAIDISGSMDGEKLDTSKQALLQIVDHLDETDRLGLVTFGSKAKVAEDLTEMDAKGKDALRAAVDKLSSKGSTAMEDGLERSLEELDRDIRGPSVKRRVFLLTDAQPNVGSTGVGSFVGIAKDAAADDIALTVWGVGLDLGAELVAEVSKLRGGNAYHFSDVAAMTERIDSEFDFMVTPLAYDLEVRGVAAQDLAVADTWGAPTDPTGDVAFGAATLFPSNRDGGMGVTLTWADGTAVEEPPAAGELLTLSATWVEVDDEQETSAEIDVTWNGGEVSADTWTRADDIGVFTMSALVDELLALDGAAAFCAGELEPSVAEAQVAEAAERLAVRAVETPALQGEAELMEALLANVQAGPDQCR